MIEFVWIWSKHHRYWYNGYATITDEFVSTMPQKEIIYQLGKYRSRPPKHGFEVPKRSKCKCIGLVHYNSCPQWELPV